MLRLKKILIISFGAVLVFMIQASLPLAQEQKEADRDEAARRARIEKEFDAESKAIFEKKCAQCHALERITSAPRPPDWWYKTAKRMQDKPHSGISEDDLKHIMYYLMGHVPLPAP